VDLSFTTEEIAFRAEVRDFVATGLPADIRAKVLGGYRLGKDDFSRWQKILHERGWGAPMWPVEFGGTGWSAVQRHIFEETSAEAGTPGQIPFGLKMVGPVIIAFGNAAQQVRFLPKIASGEEWWCQGYSEPGAGSDLASLKCSALRDGDHYLVNGQKTWNTLGQYADWIFCLVRTSVEGRPQQGISFLLIDMKTPGVTVRPIRMLDGEHEINEVWFDNVRVPVANRVGEENHGWSYAKYLLGHERTNLAAVGPSKRALNRLKEIARRKTDGGSALIDDQRFRDRIARVELELMALEMTVLRVLASEDEKRVPGAEVSILKIKGSEISQTLAELQMRALGHYALPCVHDSMFMEWQPDAVLADAWPAAAGSGSANYFNLRKTTIYGGSNEIQKNIIAQMILGLP
jgi:alkylation response protein AidB-like acyl-CoA dehydrogenase